MSFERELVSLILYSTQQLGVTLAVGGQTIMLVAYLIAMRDRVVDVKEAQYSRAVRTVLFAGLGLIILSGLGITAMHFMAGEAATLLAPAYLFKWLLVAVIGLLALGLGKGLVPAWAGEGFVGGTLYALFLLHILAPVTNWENLLIIYAGWSAAFFLCWAALVFGTREKAGALISQVKKTAPPPLVPKFEAPKPLVPPPDIPSVKALPTMFNNPVHSFASAPPLPPVPKTPAPMEVVLTPPKPLPSSSSAPAPSIPEKPAAPPAVVNLNEHPGLPAVRVMPKSPPEAGKK